MTGQFAPRRRRTTSVLTALLLTVVLLPFTGAPATAAAPVGQGFNLNPSDLGFILKQIKIAERHAATATAANPCGTLLGDGPDQLPSGVQGENLPWGLRTVDGSCNNVVAGQGEFGASDNRFPRLVPASFDAAESGDPDGPTGPAVAGPTSYAQTRGTVLDSRPRLISNLIVDQTATNTAALLAAGPNPVTTPSGALVIPNVAPDVGLSAPYNSWFTMFGQFFDHGLDLVSKGGFGNVVMPLKTDDPLFNKGVDGIAGTEDDGPNFMVLTRATRDGASNEAVNQTSPFVDQSQTYGSHPSQQVFLREYALAAGKPQATGRLLNGPGGGMATWADVKLQARTLLGVDLVDTDVLRVPLVETDPYGRFVRGPNGYPQLITPSGRVEGNPVAPVTTAGTVPSGRAFLDDIAHHAGPGPIRRASNPGTAPVFPTPDNDAGTTDDGNPLTYDDEMLNAHFIAGDGRVNENTGLTTVHHVFHSEHNRLLDESDGTQDPSDLKTVIRQHIRDSASAGRAPLFTLADWQNPDGTWNGERLFQAARFVAEMEYQHLAFEEFARKVQPLVNPFGGAPGGYATNRNPAIKAEFAHAVYRFGHSMLTESVDLVTAAGAPSSMPLLAAFLNPPAFMSGSKTPDQAAGDVVRGMTRQIGAELDEFVTEALRNKLLGLPLDLAALNIARARETGVPTLNAARRAFHAASGNTALTPYESWADLNFSLKNPASLVNFVAAYGTHPTIVDATTMVAKRAAANALVHGVNGPDRVAGTQDDILAGVPEDRYAFINSVPHTPAVPTGTAPAAAPVMSAHGTWVNATGGITTTGVDAIDLWVGGLAEKQMVFGGLLGPTFNYVFEGQMEALQEGDRFYYLSRTAGLNLLTQLEGNSFAELIQRNTDASGLPADVFSRPDLVFDLARLGTSGPVLDDPTTTEYDESVLLTRSANGTLRYGGPAHTVFNGTAGDDRVWASEGDDTIRGNDGADWMQGGDGNDNLIGGLGDDILLDLAGDDVLKGGDGDDAMSSGQGFGGDLNQGGRGNDFIVGGNDMTETFAGPGDDVVYAGDGADTVFGDDGDDWIEGGAGANLLQGDNGAPFQDDLNTAGHDVLMGFGGSQDYDAEGGDDIMLGGPGLQRAEGLAGFDWFTHRGDLTAVDSDMSFTGLLPPGVETNRDRFDLVEGLSGWDGDDVLRGNSADAATMLGHQLDAAGIARIAGLSTLLPAGATSFTGGNIIVGGAGSDLIEGRGGNDVIDGDAWLDVQLRVPDLSTPGDLLDTTTVDSLKQVQTDVLAGRIDPGAISVVRTLRPGTPGTAVDTAVFSEPALNYDVSRDATTGVTTVVHARGSRVDGSDRLRGVERLQFGAVFVVAPGAPAVQAVQGGDTIATVAFAPPANDGGDTIYEFQLEVLTGTTVVRTLVGIPGTATEVVVPGLTNGTAYVFRLRAVNAAGPGPLSQLSGPVTPAAPVEPAPAAPPAPAVQFVPQAPPVAQFVPQAPPVAQFAPAPATAPAGQGLPAPVARPLPAPVTQTAVPTHCRVRTTTALSRSGLDVGGAVRLTVRGRPGATVDVFESARPSTTFRIVRSGVTAAYGSARWDLRPRANTRWYALQRGCPVSVASPTTTVLVRAVVTLDVRRVRPGTFVFSGTALPARKEGLAISLYRLSPSGREVLVARVRSGATGTWRLTQSLSGAGTQRFLVRTTGDAQLASGRSGVRLVTGR